MGDNSAAAAAVAAPRGRFGRICVFCGSNAGNRAVFGDAALQLGQELVMLCPARRPDWVAALRVFRVCLIISLWSSWFDFCCGGCLILAQVSRGIELVYGGGSVGLMGLIAQTVLDGGCGVLGLEISALPCSSSPMAQCGLIYNKNLWLFFLILLQGDSKSTHAHRGMQFFFVFSSSLCIVQKY